MTLWSFVVYLLMPYAIGNLVWRGLRYPAYWHRWPERFGFVAPLRGLARGDDVAGTALQRAGRLHTRDEHRVNDRSSSTSPGGQNLPLLRS